MKGVPLLINPWIYDFAAHDLWAKPLGLLTIASALRGRGFPVRVLDCMDTHHPSIEKDERSRLKKGPYGTGKFRKEAITKPVALSHVRRRYSRYGISTEAFLDDLSSAETPSVIIVTSLMTYWYPGVAEAIRAARSVHPHVPVILGGIYARLCPEHAKAVAVPDLVWDGSDETGFIEAFIKERGFLPQPKSKDLAPHPYPAFDLLHGLDYVCIRTSSGCPFNCRYCASRFLNPVFSRRTSEDVLREIIYWSEEHNIKDFAFYDDALLVGEDGTVEDLLGKIANLEKDLRFHTPNALHAARITPRLARLLFEAGFKTIRLGLETADFSLRMRLDHKLKEGEFENAVEALFKAGFRGNDIGAYVLAGLPDQSPEDVYNTLYFLEGVGIMPFMAEYSPIPHTALWERAVAVSRYDILHEPLYHNNTLLPCWSEAKQSDYAGIRKAAQAVRNKVRGANQAEGA